MGVGRQHVQATRSGQVDHHRPLVGLDPPGNASDGVVRRGDDQEIDTVASTFHGVATTQHPIHGDPPYGFECRNH